MDVKKWKKQEQNYWSHPNEQEIIMDAEITVKFIIKSILCDDDDINDLAEFWETEPTLEGLTKSLIKSEGLFGLVEDDYKIISVQPYMGEER